MGGGVRVGRRVVIALAVAGVAIGLRPPEAIRALATRAFSGLALLVPVLVGAVYGLRWSVGGAMLSVIGGEAVLLGFATGLIPEVFQGGCLPLIPALAVACTVLGVDQVIARRSRSWLRT